MGTPEESYKAWDASLSARNRPPADWEKYAEGGGDHKGSVPDKAGFIQRASEIGVIQAGKEVVQDLINGGGRRSPERNQHNRFLPGHVHTLKSPRSSGNR